MGLLLGLAALLGGCTTGENAPPAPGLISRRVVSPSEQRLLVNGGGREIPSLVLLPRDFSEAGHYPLLIAVHNFAGDPAGFAKLIHASRITAHGIIVVLPAAAGLIPEWQGPGITITVPVKEPDGKRIDDANGIGETLNVVERLYPVDPGDINIAGFSQGATLALALARELDDGKAGRVRRLFLVAGSLSRPITGEKLLEGTGVTLYQPGRNGMQNIANFLTGEPGWRRFVPEIIAAKGCLLNDRSERDGVERERYRCRDGTTLRLLYEAKGEHAWPGQDARYDSWLMGRGSRSDVDFTSLIIEAIGGGMAPGA